jgi:glycosyltransferase involved in cell wall biosynthesis
LLDVLIPFYGPPTLMRLATLSVLNQTCPPDRIIIVDDGFPDATTQRWVSDLNDTRISYFRNPQKLGANRNYREALAKSRADYVVFMGADDLMGPRFVERSLELIDSFRQPDVIQCGVEVIDATGRAHRPLLDRVKRHLRPEGTPPVQVSGDHAVASLLQGNWTYFPSLVWRRTAVCEADFRDYDIVQDLALLVDVLRGGGRLVVDDEMTFRYRRHAASDSGVHTVSGKRFAEERDYFRQIGGELRAQGWPASRRAARLHLTSRLHAASLLLSALGQRDRVAAKSHLGHIFEA